MEIFDYLHDTGLSELNFDFLNRKVILTFLLWNYEEQKEIPLTLELHSVTQFNSEYEQNLEFNVVGCYSAECEITENKQYKIIFLFDFLKQAVAWKVEICCESFELTNESSKKYLQTIMNT